MPEALLETLTELQRADAGVGAELVEVESLARQVKAVQAVASRLQDFEQALPATREAAQEELARRDIEVGLASARLSEAEQAVRRASKEGAREAELFEIRARDNLFAAKRKYAEARAALDELETDVESAETEMRAAEATARDLARELGRRPRLAKAAGATPGRGPAAIAEWGETARAALFVAQGQLAAERDALIRQANELGSAALGESVGSASVAVIAQRLAQELPR